MKKLLALIICLIASLALAACNETGESGGSSATDISAVADSTTGSSTADSTTDNSSTVDSTVNSTINSSTDSSVPTIDDNDDQGEKITVTFELGFNGTLVSGETEIKIDKGSSLLPEQMPVIERNGYVVIWSYDMFGEKPWAQGDVLDENTALYVIWAKEGSTAALYAELNDRLSTLINYQLNTTTTVTSDGYESSYSSVTLVDGVNEYSKMEADGITDEMWYVDGVCYSVLSGQKIKRTFTEEEYESMYGSGGILGVPKDWIKSVSVDGNVYTVVVDGEKYTEYMEGLLSSVSASYEFEDRTYKLYFDQSGVLERVEMEFYHTVGGSTRYHSTFISTVSGIGTAVVEAPDDANEYKEYNN